MLQLYQRLHWSKINSETKNVPILFQIQFRRQKVHQDPHEELDCNYRRLYHSQQPLAGQAGKTSGQEGHGPRRVKIC